MKRKVAKKKEVVKKKKVVKKKIDRKIKCIFALALLLITIAISLLFTAIFKKIFDNSTAVFNPKIKTISLLYSNSFNVHIKAIKAFGISSFILVFISLILLALYWHKLVLDIKLKNRTRIALITSIITLILLMLVFSLIAFTFNLELNNDDKINQWSN